MTEEELLVRLSMLLDGELPDDEASALRARIAAEPAVAAAWASLQALPAALGGLPAALPPPRALDAAVLASVAPAPRRPRRWWLGAAAMAAGLGLWLSWPAADAPTITLVAGQQTVHGDVTVMAAEVPISVSGKADIFVEPQAGWVREPQQEEEGMVRMLLSMGSGVLVTVAVYEGAAIVSPPGGEAVTVNAGERHSVPVAGEVAEAPRQRRARRPKVEAGGEVSAELSAYVDELEAEVAALRMERDMHQGALRAVEGEQQPWPDDLAPEYAPEAFSSSMEALAEAHPDLDLMGIDCDEYPCLAMFRSYDEGEDWAHGVGQQIEEEWGSEDEEANLSMWASISESDDARVQLLGVSVSGPEDGENEALRHRSEWRMNDWLKATAEDAMAAQKE